MDEHRHARGEAGRIKPDPRPLAEALRDEQVTVGVDPPQPLTVGRQGQPVGAEIAQVAQQPTDPLDVWATVLVRPST